jgi:hypothetical protein
MSFKFGAPETPPMSSSGSSAGYSGTWISTVTDSGTWISTVTDVTPSDSVSNVGSVQSVTQNLTSLQIAGAAGGSGGAAGGSQATESNLLFDVYHNREWSLTRVGYDDFLDLCKNSLTYAGGPLFKAAHNTLEIRAIKSAFHMQYLHIIDVNMKTPAMLSASDAVKSKKIGEINEYLFDAHVKIQTKWGTCLFYRNFKNFIAKPVIESVYHNDLHDAFFRSTKSGFDQPLSKAAFEDWLARN